MSKVQHINISVYEIQEVKKATGGFEGKPLFKQQNNPLPVLTFSTHRISDTTIPQLLGAVTDETEVFKIFPSEEYSDDQVFNATVVTGSRIKAIKADPTQPIVVEGTEEEQFEARLKALQDKDIIVPFLMIIPETEKYMYDLTISHIPADAIARYSDAAMVMEGEEIPMAIDPLGMFAGETPTAKEEE